MINTILFSPLEQFYIIPFIDFNFKYVDFSITNITFVLLLIFFLVTTLLLGSVKQKDSTFYIIPNRWQTFLELVYKGVLSLVVTNIDKKTGQLFFPLFFSFFYFILCTNIIGLIPYSFTLTSHIIVTFTLSLFFFIGINIICIKTHGLKFFSLFLPAGTSFVLGLLLVPIELISYMFKPISLSIRLFANMMAGHTLLKVIAGFGWSLIDCSFPLFFIHYIPIIVIIPLFGLELGVALIQAFVFTTLCTIYLNDAIKLH
jgi:ATP synthase subunit 6